MTSDTNDTVLSKTGRTLRGVNSGAKAETRAGLWSSIDFGMKSRQPTGSTVRPDTEGQAFEETMNKAVRYQGTAFRSIQAILSDVIKGFMLQQTTMQADRSFRRCLIGGTFDRFHSGHQLLIQTALRQADFIEVHVVNDEMAQAKGDWVQSLDDRMETLLDWLSDTAHLRYEIHVLNDPMNCTHSQDC